MHTPKEKKKKISIFQPSTKPSGDFFWKNPWKLSRGTTLQVATQEMSPVARPYRCLSFHPIAPAPRADGWSHGCFPESVLERKEATPNATWRFGNPQPWEASKMLARGHLILNLLACLLMHMDLSFISSKHSMDSLGATLVLLYLWLSESGWHPGACWLCWFFVENQRTWLIDWPWEGGFPQGLVAFMFKKWSGHFVAELFAYKMSVGTRNNMCQKKAGIEGSYPFGWILT